LLALSFTFNIIFNNSPQLSDSEGELSTGLVDIVQDRGKEKERKKEKREKNKEKDKRIGIFVYCLFKRVCVLIIFPFFQITNYNRCIASSSRQD